MSGGADGSKDQARPDPGEGEPAASARAAAAAAPPRPRPRWAGDTAAGRTPLRERILTGLGLGFAALAIFLFVIMPLELPQQAVLAVLTVLLFALLNRNRSRFVTIFLVLLSFAVSTRYLWWRATETLVFDTPLDSVLGHMLFAAEAYIWLTLLLGYLQSVWPSGRVPVPMPADLRQWPVVDVFITTYNEPLSVVRATVLAAQSIDWPRDKLNVYLLDDGRREEFRLFAELCGCGYITRPDNQHAKAGNLNHALGLTNGAFVAVLDCDHVPTRAFLQVTVGALLADPKLGFVQTPQHYYSPDPFERNLGTEGRVPNESRLFYGVLQPGNDFWNAAMFCGSSAVLRRAALDDVGGFRTETLTEDAHTSLAMHRRGWNSAYVDAPLSAGLATESLAAHIVQRVRWAQGMTQIFRRDNPLLGRGLSLAQRLCYLSAQLYHLFALPRLVLLAAPLAYLLFRQNIIAASAMAVLVHAAPHVVHALWTRSRLAGNKRHSFWGEIYANLILFHILGPTLRALLRPRQTRFHVTDKGHTLRQGFFDFTTVRHLCVLACLLALGIGVGLWQLMAGLAPAAERPTILLNLFWAGAAFLFVVATIAVGGERRQRRATHRVAAGLPLVVLTEGGHSRRMSTVNLSLEGAMLKASVGRGFVQAGDALEVEFEFLEDAAMVAGRVVAVADRSLRIQFTPRDIEEERTLVRAVFGRADAWLDRDREEPDRVLRSGLQVIGAAQSLFTRGWRERLGRGGEGEGEGPGAGEAPGVVGPDWRSPAERARTPAAMAIMALLLAAGLAGASALSAVGAAAQGLRLPSDPSSAWSPTAPFGASPVPVPVPAPVPVPPPSAYRPPETPGSVPPPPPDVPGARPGAIPLPPQRVPPPLLAPEALLPPLPTDPSVSPPLPPGARPDLPPDRFGPIVVPAIRIAPVARQEMIRLEDMQPRRPVNLSGMVAETSHGFGLRADERVIEARLMVHFAFSTDIDPEASRLVVMLNGQRVDALPLQPDRAVEGQAEIEIPTRLLAVDNRLQFRLEARRRRAPAGNSAPAVQACPNPRDPGLWLRVLPDTHLLLGLEQVPIPTDLAQLPLPFADPRDIRPLMLPFVVPPSPSAELLQAAGAVAAHFGAVAGAHGASFPVLHGRLPRGNAVLFATASERPGVGPEPSVVGPSLGIVANPIDPAGRILIVSGRDAEQVRAAAGVLAFGTRNLSGAMAVLPAPTIAPRQPNDAPRWVPSDRPVRLADLVAQAALQAEGLSDQISVPFRVSPGLFLWHHRTAPLELRFDLPSGLWLDLARSRARVSLNGRAVAELPILPPRSFLGALFSGEESFQAARRPRRLELPTALLQTQNRLDVAFALQPVPVAPGASGECPTLPASIQTRVNADSVLDLTGVPRFTALPDLALFAQSGFPYTARADLGDTAVVLPEQPTTAEIEAFLALMGQFGEITGYPALRLRIVSAANVEDVADRHLIVIGPPDRQALVGRWRPALPYRLGGDGEILPPWGTMLRRLLVASEWAGSEAESSAFRVAQAAGAARYALIAAFESPLASGRNVLLLSGTETSKLGDMLRELREGADNGSVHGDLAVFADDRFGAFRSWRQFFVGQLPFWTRLRWTAGNYPTFVFIGLLAGLIVLATLLHRAARRRHLPGQQQPAPPAGQAGARPGPL